MANANIGIYLELIIYGYIAWMIISLIQVAVRSTRQNAENSKDANWVSTTGEPMNLLGMAIILMAVAVLISVKVGFEMDGGAGDWPALIIAAVPLVLVGVMAFTNLVMYALGKKKRQRWGCKTEDYELSKTLYKKIDRNRKLYHILALFIFIGVLWGGYDLVQKYVQTHPESQNLVDNYWGATDGLNYMSGIFIRNTPPFGQSILILWMIGQTFVLLTIEITRLSKSIHYPFQRVVQLTLRYKELDTFGAYTHFDVGYLLVAAVQPPLLFLATMCLIAFADPLSSTIGIRFGKRRFKWNGKSLEGTIAGALGAFFTMFLFVGPIYSLIGAIGFVIVDLLTPTPIKFSDNLTMPIVNVILFGILSLIGIPCVNYLGVP